MRLRLSGVVVLYASWTTTIGSGRTPAAWQSQDRAIHRADLDVVGPTTIWSNRTPAVWGHWHLSILRVGRDVSWPAPVAATSCPPARSEQCSGTIPLVVVQTARVRSVDNGAGIAPPTVVDASSHTPNTSRRRPSPFLLNDVPTLLPTEVAFLLATVARMGRALRFKFRFISCPMACAPALAKLARMGPPT